MGAMIIGMITGTVAMFVMFVSMVACGTVLAIVAHKLKMNAFWWGIAGFLFHELAAIVFVITIVRINKRKCPSCETKINENANYCPACGEEVKKIDNKKIAKTFIKVMVFGFIAVVFFEVTMIAFADSSRAGTLPWKELLIFSAISGIVGYIFSRRNKNKWIFTALGVAVPWAEYAVCLLIDYAVNVLNVFNL